MPRVNIAFTRTGTFTLRGKASVDVKNENNWEDIYTKAEEQQFTEFLPQNMEYANSVWEFEPLEEGERESNDKTT